MLVAVFVALASLGPLTPLSSTPAQAEVSRARHFNLYERPLYADGEVWSCSGGSVITFPETGGPLIQRSAPEPAQALCKWNGRIVLITYSREKREWVLRGWSGRDWVLMTRLRAEWEVMLGAIEDAGTLLLLTTTRLIQVIGDQANSVCLSMELEVGSSTLLCTSGHVFLGLARGEWGGGLWRVERRTGQVTDLGGTWSEVPPPGLEALLYKELDPVTGVMLDPWNPGCVIATVGSLHGFSDGRILRACGPDLGLVYTRPIDAQWPKGVLPVDLIQLEAFTDLAIGMGELWAAGIEGLHLIRRGGLVSHMPMPHFDDVNGVRVSLDVPGFVIVASGFDAEAPHLDVEPWILPR